MQTPSMAIFLRLLHFLGKSKQLQSASELVLTVKFVYL